MKFSVILLGKKNKIKFYGEKPITHIASHKGNLEFGKEMAHQEVEILFKIVRYKCI
jgi:hypothetical protein